MKKYIYLIALLIGIVSLSYTNLSNKKQSGDKSASAYYSEQYRPQFHFSPQKGWMNDPNGMVYYAGEYHLFYQYYPDSTVWGPMHWGHAVSKDLIHWEHLPIALYPDSIGYIFSGSAVVDWKNTTGFGSVENPPLVAIFTYHNMDREKSGKIDYENQGIAYSLDKGRTWNKYQNNPVLHNPGVKDFRDPKVLWHEGTQKWNLILSAHDRVKIYSSGNLKDWQPESEFGSDAGAHGGVWECPDLFPLKVNAGGQTKWVMIVNMNPGGPNGGSGTQYFVGDYDGHEFTAASKETSWLDYGRDNYAGVTWSDVPKEDGRRLFLGWMSNWNYATVVPTDVWRSAMTVPRELKLEEIDGKFLVKSEPVHELNQLQDQASKITFAEEQISGEKKLDTKDINLNQCELVLNLETGKSTADSLCLILENGSGEAVKIGYSNKSKQFFVDRTKSGNMNFSDRFSGIDYAPYSIGKQVQLHLFIDAASIEIFVDEGKLVMTDLFFSSENFNALKIFSSGGDVLLQKVEIVGLKRIW
ncbi:MAG: glycoside hydrolase family 32 protein [Bacteroidota bacterium]|nr:glycosyl hydrolase family 32 [Odoribacter sp.]MDP3643230.1 glycoside hydrolase family 32 protein [Bacteroidota bacterium]